MQSLMNIKMSPMQNNVSVSKCTMMMYHASLVSKNKDLEMKIITATQRTKQTKLQILPKNMRLTRNFCIFQSTRLYTLVPWNHSNFETQMKMVNVGLSDHRWTLLFQKGRFILALMQFHCQLETEMVHRLSYFRQRLLGSKNVSIWN